MVDKLYYRLYNQFLIMPPYSPPSKERSEPFCAKFIQVDGRLLQTAPAVDLSGIVKHMIFAQTEGVWNRITELLRRRKTNEYDGGSFHVNPQTRTLSVGGNASSIGILNVDKNARRRTIEMFEEQTPGYKIIDITI